MDPHARGRHGSRRPAQHSRSEGPGPLRDRRAACGPVQRAPSRLPAGGLPPRGRLGGGCRLAAVPLRRHRRAADLLVGGGSGAGRAALGYRLPALLAPVKARLGHRNLWRPGRNLPERRPCRRRRGRAQPLARAVPRRPEPGQPLFAGVAQLPQRDLHRHRSHTRLCRIRRGQGAGCRSGLRRRMPPGCSARPDRLPGRRCAPAAGTKGLSPQLPSAPCRHRLGSRPVVSCVLCRPGPSTA